MGIPVSIQLLANLKMARQFLQLEIFQKPNFRSVYISKNWDFCKNIDILLYVYKSREGIHKNNDIFNSFGGEIRVLAW
jgi:hypothetical protein